MRYQTTAVASRSSLQSRRWARNSDREVVCGAAKGPVDRKYDDRLETDANHTLGGQIGRGERVDERHTQPSGDEVGERQAVLRFGHEPADHSAALEHPVCELPDREGQEGRAVQTLGPDHVARGGAGDRQNGQTVCVAAELLDLPELLLLPTPPDPVLPAGEML